MEEIFQAWIPKRRISTETRVTIYTITEAAKKLGITRAAVHRAIKQGSLEAERGEIIKVVRTKTEGWKISERSLNYEWLNHHIMRKTFF